MDSDIALLMNNKSKDNFDSEDKNDSVSFGSDNNDWGEMTPDDGDGEDGNMYDKDDEDISVFSDENDNTNTNNNQFPSTSPQSQPFQPSQPNLFMNPNSSSMPTGNSMGNDDMFNMQQTRQQIEQEKSEILYQIERLKKRGINFPRSFSMASNLADMKAELARIKKDLEIDASIRFQRKTLISSISGLEFANAKFNPLKFNLDGWSESISDNINDYDDVFEELHEKYKSKSKMPPEVNLLMMVAGSGFMTHMTNTLFRSNGNSMTIDNLFKSNPDLQKQFAGAAVDHMQKTDKEQGGGNEGILNMFKGMFSGDEQQTPQNPMTKIQEIIPPAQQPKMKGPNTSDIDNILQELNLSNNTAPDTDRFETMSGISLDKKSQTSLLSSLVSKERGGKNKITI